MKGIGTGAEIPVFTGMTGSNTAGACDVRTLSYSVTVENH